jgi:hypothetical protein
VQHFLDHAPVDTSRDVSSTNGLLTIGRREHIDFMDWEIWGIRAKTDTGAFSSALDVAWHEWFERAGTTFVRFQLTRKPKALREPAVIETPVLRMVRVGNAFGLVQERPLVETTIRIGLAMRRIRLTLTNRAHMRCPMLLGRQALVGAFLVDVRSKYLLSGKHR